ncbi:MAG TPA: plastocyanin/azurin family copper-binding protein [Longimicrobiaceae bacterium]|nr:plastocyanin/azurin family copper-binding protein [Longimicrobiaceae bacterium]
MYLERLALTTVMAVVLAACGGGGGGTPVEPNPPGQNPPAEPTSSATVVTSASAFSPKEVNLLRGGTVTWNIGAVAHNVIFNKVAGAPEDVGVISNAQVSRTFNTAGSFPYDCTLHAGMTGTVNVK